ncbi:MAG: type II/IV secretion system ATPase subunit [Candidatus Hydrothermarchaeaceae archaeon]
MGCNYRIKTDGNDRILNIDCTDCIYGMSLEDSEECMKRVLETLYREHDVDSIVLSELAEREYDSTQTKVMMDFVTAIENTRDWPFLGIIPKEIGCDECKSERQSDLERLLSELLFTDPIRAYKELLNYIQKEESKKEGADLEKCVECGHYYVANLNRIKGVFESLSIFNIEDLPEDGRAVYRRFLSPSIRPYFSTSRLLLEPPSGSTIVSKYNVGDTVVRIYLLPGKPERMYFVSPPEYSLSAEKFEIVNNARQEMIRHNPESLDFADPGKAREYFKRFARRAVGRAAVNMEKDISRGDIEELAEILAKYTAGTGILEVLLSDPHVQDVYINAPASENPISIIHSVEEGCLTNIYLTEDDTESLVSRFRARSGRAFSESHPSLDLELQEFGTRVTTIGRPLSPDGVAFALRRQKSTPWTLPQFIKNGMITPRAAGLLSFFIDGQATMLITGSRGSGKTSLLVSLLSELTQNLRILTIEDTLEIPVSKLNSIGYRIQRIKIQSSVGKAETEMTPQEALGTALRLGESVLVIGEVRGPETKILYESMRIGAAGNSVLGTIHGASTQSVFERVVYDIGIPASSFKATDIVVTSAPIRMGGGLKRLRRVLQISEVSKDWHSQNPDPKDVFKDLMVYNSAKDCLDADGSFSKSEIISSIAARWDMTVEQALKNIELRANIKKDMVDFSEQNNFDRILEVDHVVTVNNEFRALNEKQIRSGSVDYYVLYRDWKKWFKGYCTKVMEG